MKFQHLKTRLSGAFTWLKQKLRPKSIVSFVTDHTSELITFSSVLLKKMKNTVSVCSSWTSSSLLGKAAPHLMSSICCIESSPLRFHWSGRTVLLSHCDGSKASPVMVQRNGYSCRKLCTLETSSSVSNSYLVNLCGTHRSMNSMCVKPCWWGRFWTLGSPSPLKRL